MNRIKKIAVAALCGATFASSYAMANLVADPGFEANDGSWAVAGWGITDFGRGTHTGSNSVATGCSAAADLTTCTFSQSLTTTPGSLYNISFFLYTDGLAGDPTIAFPNGLQVSFDGVVVDTILDFPSTNPDLVDFVPGGPPTLLSINNVLATTGSTVLQFGGFHGLSFIFVDDVSVLAVPEPASLALLAAGLGGLGFSRRKKA